MGNQGMAQVIDLQEARRRREPEPYVSKQEIAAYLRVTTRTVDRWRKDGLPGHKAYANSPVKFRRSEVDSWLKGRAA